MKCVALADAKDSLGALIEGMAAGETIVITEDGVPVANLVRPPVIDWEARLDQLERDGIIRRGRSAPPVAMIMAPFPAGPRPFGAVEQLLKDREESDR